VNIIEAVNDQKLFGSLFKDQGTWSNWKVALKAVFGLPMDKKEKQIYRKFTGRKRIPRQQFKENFFIVGRRGGKSFISAVIACYLALFHDWRPFLAPGEKGWIMIIASDRTQARVIMGYIKAILQLKIFKNQIDKELTSEIWLKNQVLIRIATCDYRTLRGYTILAAVCDEIAFWRSEGANPAEEILTALRPALATVPGSLLLGISTPYAKSGPLYENFRDLYGKEDPDTLIWRAATIDMNPTIPKRVIDKSLKDDYAAGKAEWLAEFREDLETFLPTEVIEAAIVRDRWELPRVEEVGAYYQAFCDFSSGRADSSVLAIAHKDSESGKIILDRLEEKRPPFKPASAIGEFSEILPEYNIERILADKYAIGYVQEAVENLGICFEFSELSKSEIYLEFEPLMAQGMVELLDNTRLRNQLRSLERRTRSGGKDQVDHPKGLHDDLANAAAGACVLAAKDEYGGWGETIVVG
jgi:hypothetical protein